MPDRPSPGKHWLRGAAALAILTGALFSLTRIVLLAMTGIQAVPPGRWIRLFFMGVGFDLLVLAMLIAPYLAWSAIAPNRLRTHRVYPFLRLIAIWAGTFVLLFNALAEIVFWMEFSTRFNFIAVDYLLYTHEVIGNIRESYPVGWLLGGLALIALVPAAWMARRWAPAEPRPWRLRARFAALAVLLPIASYAASNVDRMGGSGNAFADELAGNGFMTFAAAVRRNELDYDRFYATLPQAEADRILHRLDVKRAPLVEALLPQAGEAPPSMGPLKRSPRHVVLISVESLSAEFLGTYGGKRQLTPHLDRIAREGYRFSEVFATGTRTVRGLEALSLGTPPVPGQSIVRRPNNEHLATLGQILGMQGFEPLFVYGGYGYFDNMNAYFRGNAYRIIDRTDFPKSSVAFENAWGVADESLFANAITAIGQTVNGGKRVFAHIMTTSNHRPFTYPKGRIDIPSPGGRDGGVKYTDYAIGAFLEAARKEPWFKDTLFVITADHCASVAGKNRLPVDKYRIPMIWYGPGLVEPGVHEGMVSQLDVAPTLLEVLGVEGDDHFFGRSVFEQKPSSRRAFISNYQALGYLKNGVLTVLLPKRKVEAYRVDPASLEETRIAVDPALQREAIAYYQTAAHAFKEGQLQAPAVLASHRRRAIHSEEAEDEAASE